VLVAAGCFDDSAPEPSARGDRAVLVVGAGLAGMTAALRLHQAGMAVQVHEAAGRIGGRTRTVRDFSPERTVEAGGEFVNSDHDALRALADELGLVEDDLYAAYPDGTGPVLVFDGAEYASVLEDWTDVRDAVARDFAAAGPDVRAADHTPAAAALDRRSLAEWIEAEVPGGSASRFGRFLTVTFETEYGGPADNLSSLALIEAMGPTATQSFDPLGGSDERWHIRGGNDSVVTAIDEALPSGAVTLDSRLVALRSDGDRATATFERDGTTADVTADRVVLALPFSLLREVDLDGAGLTETKLRAIRELGMGTNAKLHLEHADRAWYEAGHDGCSTSDTGLQVTWEESIAQPGPAGLLVAFTGGTVGASYPADRAHGPAPDAVRDDALADEARVFGPAVAGAATGRARLDSWIHDPCTRGSYSYWAVGQYTGIRGEEGTAEPPLHFCGEHTSLRHQGFMNGAVESGERAAAEIIG
jgi:monoamine oxidase